MSRLSNHRFLNWRRVFCVAHHIRIQKHIFVKALFLGGVTLLTQGLYMDVKAMVAQGLIANSWLQRTAGSPPPKPWWWADTKAIAKLEVERLGEKVFVMQDDSGESLAFGPGHLRSSAGISNPGHVMIAGHRDSHFKFLEHLKIGDIISTTNHRSLTARYRVNEIAVIDSTSDALVLYEQDRLSLITCFPFDSVVPGGPLRYIVNAVPLGE